MEGGGRLPRGPGTLDPGEVGRRNIEQSVVPPTWWYLTNEAGGAPE
jgi:hypothetical protein